MMILLEGVFFEYCENCNAMTAHDDVLDNEYTIRYSHCLQCDKFNFIEYFSDFDMLKYDIDVYEDDGNDDY